MREIDYYNKFKQDMKEEGIDIRISKYGFFNIVLSKSKFLEMETIENNGLHHILDYDFFEIGGKYRLIQKLEFIDLDKLVE